MGCAGSKADNTSKPAPGSVDLKGQPSKEELDAAAQVIQAAALAAGAGEEPAPAPSAAELQAATDAARYGPIVATQAEAIEKLFKQLDVNGDSKLVASELSAVVSQYTGTVFKEKEFMGWFDVHGASGKGDPDGSVDLKEFGWYLADVALSFGEGAEAITALPTVVSAFEKLLAGRTPMLTKIYAELDVGGTGKVDFAAYKRKVKNPLFAKAFKEIDADADGFVTLEEWVKGAGKLGAKMSDEKFEAELKALFRESSKGARAMAKELLAARLAAIFKAVNVDGSGSVTRAELRAKLEADAELQTLLGKSGAWALYVLKQLDASGDGKVSLAEFKGGLEAFVDTREQARRLPPPRPRRERRRPVLHAPPLTPPSPLGRTASGASAPPVTSPEPSAPPPPPTRPWTVSRRSTARSTPSAAAPSRASCCGTGTRGSGRTPAPRSSSRRPAARRPSLGCRSCSKRPQRSCRPTGRSRSPASSRRSSGPPPPSRPRPRPRGPRREGRSLEVRARRAARPFAPTPSRPCPASEDLSRSATTARPHQKNWAPRPGMGRVDWL